MIDFLPGARCCVPGFLCTPVIFGEIFVLNNSALFFVKSKRIFCLFWSVLHKALIKNSFAPSRCIFHKDKAWFSVRPKKILQIINLKH